MRKFMYTKRLVAGVCVAALLLASGYAFVLNQEQSQKDKALIAELSDELRKFAEEGDDASLFVIGASYVTGTAGVLQDLEVGAIWLRKAADQGNAAAQWSLGNMYRNGEGVEQDYLQAVAWYRKAAEQGDSMAQKNLGEMYDLGLGVVQNYQEAYAWLSVATANGAYSAETRDLVAAKLTPAALNEARALAERYFQQYKSVN